MSIEREAVLTCDDCGVVGVRGAMPFPSQRVRAITAMKGWTFTTKASTPRGGCQRTDRCPKCTDKHFGPKAEEKPKSEQLDPPCERVNVPADGPPTAKKPCPDCGGSGVRVKYHGGSLVDSKVIGLMMTQEPCGCLIDKDYI